MTPEPSVVRAGVMAAIAMLGILLGRPGAGLSLLTAAVVVLLLAEGLSRWVERPAMRAIRAAWRARRAPATVIAAGH